MAHGAAIKHFLIFLENKPILKRLGEGNKVSGRIQQRWGKSRPASRRHRARRSTQPGNEKLIKPLFIDLDFYGREELLCTDARGHNKHSPLKSNNYNGALAIMKLL